MVLNKHGGWTIFQNITVSFKDQNSFKINVAWNLVLNNAMLAGQKLLDKYPCDHGYSDHQNTYSLPWINNLLTSNHRYLISLIHNQNLSLDPSRPSIFQRFSKLIVYVHVGNILNIFTQPMLTFYTSQL